MKFLAGLVTAIVLGQATAAGADIVTINFSGTRSNAVGTNVISGRLSFDDRTRANYLRENFNTGLIRETQTEFIDPEGTMEVVINGERFVNKLSVYIRDTQFIGPNQGAPGSTNVQFLSAMPSENIFAVLSLTYFPSVLSSPQEGSAFGDLGRLVDANNWPSTQAVLGFTNIFSEPQYILAVNYSVNYSEQAVPETAAWTMMICGFGVMGCALRRRSRSSGRTISAI